jgi:N-acetylneuraminic acid mutarotase
MRVATGLVVAFVCSTVLAGPPVQRTLTFEDRVKAQTAIERVYYSHQVGATKAFEDAVPKTVIEAKVQKYLDQSAALSTVWKTAISDQLLQRELERMAENSRMPERLSQLYGALQNDSFIIKECLVRSILVDRLTHNFYALDPVLHANSHAQAAELHRQLVAGELSPTADSPNRVVVEIVSQGPGAAPTMQAQKSQIVLSTDDFRKLRSGLPRHIGRVSEVAEARRTFAVSVILSESTNHLQVARFVVQKREFGEWWETVRTELAQVRIDPVATDGAPLPQLRTGNDGGASSAPFVGGHLPARVDDVWDNGILGDVPGPIYACASVWTGSDLVIWGGSDDYNLLNTGWRYNPATDTWARMSTVGAPEARELATAVWTGSSVIVWGGFSDSGILNTGGRYDPTTDRWLATTTVGAASPRYSHTAIWTGSVMVVWGGNNAADDNVLSTGGRYDPAADTWTPTSTGTNTPSQRAYHSAVWTGQRMVIWGGTDVQYAPTQSGGRYDPVADRWEPTSNTGAPSGRSGQVAVWTGSRMLIWGPDRSGGRYDPVLDTWTPVSTLNSPTVNYASTGVWTGTHLVVFGGFSGDPAPHFVNTGARYDPSTDTWTPTTTVGAPAPRYGQVAVWTGDRMIIWGGVGLSSGGRYDPATDSWTPTSTAGAPLARYEHAAVWTGSKMLIWGGISEDVRNTGDGNAGATSTGGCYDPALDSWMTTSIIGAPSPRTVPNAIWTGDVVVVWSGYSDSATLNTGGRYDPLRDTWSPTSTLAAPDLEGLPTVVWTGREMLIWGTSFDTTYENLGGRYNPTTDTWQPMSVAGAPTPRVGHSAVWSGNRMLIWGGYNPNGVFVSTAVGLYDPLNDAWSISAAPNSPARRYDQSTVWTGREMLVWGGVAPGTGQLLNAGSRYSPSTDTWRPISPIGGPGARYQPSAVWTGTQMIVWGGATQDGYLQTGARYSPETDGWTPTSTLGAPSPRQEHTAVWAGTSMIVWGGYGTGYPIAGGRYISCGSSDADGDGISECDGDCDDTNAAVFPGAPQVCDGVNNDCSDPAWPAVPSNDGDADGDGFLGCRDDCDDTLASVHPGAPEVCNGVDDNCDGVVDNGGSAMCDDGNFCTDDSCNQAGACISTFNTRPCDDGDACTIGDVCGNGSCHGTPSSGNACNDGNACTTNDTCHAGTCTGGALRICDDGDYCTDDSCDPATGCIAISNIYRCDDGNPCTDNSCDPASGCVFPNNSAPCDDGNFCTINDVCRGGTCTTGTPRSCSDSNPCTDDSCDPAAGCLHVNNSNACDDGYQCTVNDKCTGGYCQGTPTYETHCDDGNVCTTDDACQGYYCYGGAPRNCDDGNPCTDDYCDSYAGGCVHYDDDTNPCSDGDLCTQGESCSDGVCAGALPVDCNSTCPVGFATIGTLCAKTYLVDASLLDNLAAHCDSSGFNRYNNCNSINYGFHWHDLGADLAGVMGVEVQFEAGVSCGMSTSAVTLNGLAIGTFSRIPNCSCAPPHETISLNHINVGAYVKAGFNTISIIPSGQCEGLTRTATLDDAYARVTVTYAAYSHACQVGTCVPATGTCSFINASDGSSCATPCVAGGTCQTGSCLGTAVSCDDNNSCTDDACDPVLGCVHVPNSAPCDQGNACIIGGTCAQGACIDGTPVQCDDFNDCTADDCDPATGCVHVNRDGLCDDGNRCTANDFCSGGSCHSGPPLDCSDGNACNGLETCNPAFGCVYGATPDCDDHNPCTDDSCVPSSGCVHTNNSKACDDGSVCTAGDTCWGGACHGIPIMCDDGNLCTADTCNPATGCVFTNTTNLCDDGNACTTNDACGPLPNPTPFAENFDGVTVPALPSGWTSSVVGAGGAWVTRSSVSETLPNSAFGVDNDLLSDTMLDSPAIAIATAFAKLTFRNRWSFEDVMDCYDAGVLEIKIGTGSYVDILDAGGSFASGGYTGTVSPYFGNPLANRSAWCNTSTGYPGYVTSAVNLPPAAAGQTIRLRWRLGSDSANSTVGQDIDSIVVTELSNVCHGGPAPNCDDNNPCTDDSCNPTTGCVHTINTNLCSDGNACTSGDRCSGGTCHGTPILCNDNNACTTDSCNPATGCAYVNNTNSCSDGDACTTGDTCSGGTCRAGAPLVCNDNNACTTDTCNPATGCVYTNNTNSCSDGNACTAGDTCSGGSCHAGPPVACAPADSCHSAGTCNPATGVCASVNAPDGTACSDNNLCTTGDSCHAGICTPTYNGLNHPRPKSAGYYEQLCDAGHNHGHSAYHGDHLTDADALCVAGLAATFDYFTTVDDICNVLDDDNDHGWHGGRHHGCNGNGPDGNDCDKAENELIATALNICRARVCLAQDLDSHCHGNNHSTVAQSFADGDAILDNGSRDQHTCSAARCELREINNGHALEMNTLVLSMEIGKVRLTWEQPVMDDGAGTPSYYEIWRRPMGSGDDFTKIGQNTGLSFLDGNAGTAVWEYDVSAVIP